MDRIFAAHQGENNLMGWMADAAAESTQTEQGGVFPSMAPPP